MSKRKAVKKKNGRKPKSIADRAEALYTAQHRLGAAMTAALAAIDGGSAVRTDLRLTAAEIGWLRIVMIARGESDSLAMEASKFLIEQTHGKASPKAESVGEHSFTITIH